MAGLITGASIISGELIVSLDSGEIIRVGYVQGPQGLQGQQGPMGATGRAGQDGNTILNGAGTPRADEGRDGDFWIDTVEWTIRLKASGRWGAPQPLIAPAKNRSGEFGSDRRMTGGPGRFFPMGGVSSAVSLPSDSGNGLQPILGNGLGFGTNRQMLCSDSEGDLLKVILFFRHASGGVYSCEVVAMRGATAGSLAIAWEMSDPSAGLPTVNFSTEINGNALEVWAVSTGPWAQVRGGYLQL